MYRKIGFDRVLKNLKFRKYRGKIRSLDYANTGYQPFNYRKFADNLGISVEILEEYGLFKYKDIGNGWELIAEPTCDDLIKFRESYYKLFN